MNEKNQLPLIVLTRPIAQNHSLITALNDDWGNAIIQIPGLSIEAANIEKSAQQLALLKEYDLIIFTSANAVHYAAPLWQHAVISKIIGSASPQIIAVGPGTAAACAEHHIIQCAKPDTYSQAGILEMPCCKAVTGKSILIICGEDPKPDLASTLKSRGAQVTECQCYKRLPPPKVNPELIKRLQQAAKTTWVITSAQSAKNLWQQAEEQGWLEWWLHCDIICIHAKQMDALKNLGWQGNIKVTESSCDEAIIKTIKMCYTPIRRR